MHCQRRPVICSSSPLHRESQWSTGKSSGANFGVAEKNLQETHPVKSRSILSLFVSSGSRSLKDRLVNIFRLCRRLPAPGFIAVLAATSLAPSLAAAQQSGAHRPPAAPLIAND